MLRPDCGDKGSLVAWISFESGEIEQSWEVKNLDSYLENYTPPSDWRSIYYDFKFRTDSEVKADAHARTLEQARQVKFLKILLFLWLSAIPAGYAIFAFFGPEWLGLIGLAIVLWNAQRIAMRISGREKPSPKELEIAAKKRKMEHYFYHCERNPSGFLRLKAENFESDNRERVRKESDELSRKLDQ